MAKYYVGQKLWWVPNFFRKGDQHEVVVVSVGRKWATLDNGARIPVTHSLPTLTDRGTDHAVYESQKAYQRHRRVMSNWSRFCTHLDRIPMPADMTTDKIVAAAKLLGIDVEIVSSEEANDGN